jgi:hypothetical protein
MYQPFDLAGRTAIVTSIEDFGGIAVCLARDASAYAPGEQFLVDGGLYEVLSLRGREDQLGVEGQNWQRTHQAAISRGAQS